MDEPGGPLPPMAGRVCLVTGATGAMGRVLVTELARAGATVVAACRDGGRGEELRHDVAGIVGADRVEVLVGDLARQYDVRAVAAGFLLRHDRLHVLVNNAGALFRHVEAGPDGVERHLAVNHLAGFTLTSSLLPALRAAAPSRVVNLVTDLVNDTRAVPLGRGHRPAPIVAATLAPPQGLSPLAAYAAAKLAALTCGYALAAELAGTGVTVNAVHPGVVASGILDAALPPSAKPVVALYRRFALTPEQGARATLRLATDPALVGVTGRYFLRFAEGRSPDASYDLATQRAVMETSRRLSRSYPAGG